MKRKETKQNQGTCFNLLLGNIHEGIRRILPLSIFGIIPCFAYRESTQTSLPYFRFLLKIIRGLMIILGYVKLMLDFTRRNKKAPTFLIFENIR